MINVRLGWQVGMSCADSDAGRKSMDTSKLELSSSL